MKGARSKLRTTAVAAGTISVAGLLATGLASSASAQAAAPGQQAVAPGTVVRQPFAADSGDACRYGVVKGQLGWHIGPVTSRPTVVDVDGTLVDRPLPTDSDAACGDDGRYSIATFTAYAGSAGVARAAVRVDNGAQPVRFTLANTTSTAGITLVVVQVCRPPLVGLRPVYCGAKQEYRAPVSTTVSQFSAAKPEANSEKIAR